MIFFFIVSYLVQCIKRVSNRFHLIWFYRDSTRFRNGGLHLKRMGADMLGDNVARETTEDRHWNVIFFSALVVMSFLFLCAAFSWRFWCTAVIGVFPIVIRVSFNPHETDTWLTQDNSRPEQFDKTRGFFHSLLSLPPIYGIYVFLCTETIRWW